ncbi:MAG: signal peptidase I [Kiritimatiellae bacterium]|nr:signal peptidase I [Kiritimatiellia bacterium]MDW8458978.1 signal peptidase I [Verrucomicrobiota bacterium]
MRGLSEWLSRRRLRKAVRHLLHEAAHLRRMREDIASSASIDAVRRAEEELRHARQSGDRQKMEEAAERLGAALELLAPPRAHPRLRENLEVLVVALVVAMGFRTYFIQPFKIPTGSMQPTLYGITVTPQKGKKWYDYFPINLIPLALFGERYQEVRARADGRLEARFDESEESIRLYVSGVPHDLPRGMVVNVQPGSQVRRGEILASGRVRLGDHIFVNKVIYNFSRPKRGDIFVFSTDGIDYPRIRPDSFYIKRIAALPGEQVQLDPPYLVVNGSPVIKPYPFERMQDKRKGYHGYQLPISDGRTRLALGFRGQTLKLSEFQYLPLGDNTMSSLDGRYFGGVDRKNIVGPAFMVYWPFGRRWGWVR